MRARGPVEATQSSGAALAEACGTTGTMHVHKQLDDLDAALEEIDDGVAERNDELASALDKAERYEHTMKVWTLLLNRHRLKYILV